MKKDAQKPFNMIVALILAIALWGFCVVDVNPTSNVSVKGINIQYEGLEQLEYSDLVITSGMIDTMNLVVSGQRSVTSTLRPTSFKVTCDVASLDEGKNKVTLFVRTPEGVSIESQSVKTFVVTVEKIISVEKPIYGVIINQQADSDIAEIVSISKDTVLVKGAESIVNSVNYVKATVDATKLGNEITVIDSNLVPVDSNGNTVEGVELGRASVSCRAQLVPEEITEDPNIEEPSENPEGEGDGEGEGTEPEPEGDEQITEEEPAITEE